MVFVRSLLIVGLSLLPGSSVADEPPGPAPAQSAVANVVPTEGADAAADSPASVAAPSAADAAVATPADKDASGGEEKSKDTTAPDSEVAESELVENKKPAGLSTDKLATLIFGLIGGLGIFLLGMKYMSEGMQAVAGSSLRTMIGLVTSHRLLATLV
ncbi:MAG: hypothetical protein KDA85_01130, partial [Planctomycetaceae bacterium]|nr:hypothetical protein [Planctomycetaceae bacterium]